MTGTLRIFQFVERIVWFGIFQEHCTHLPLDRSERQLCDHAPLPPYFPDQHPANAPVTFGVGMHMIFQADFFVKCIDVALPVHIDQRKMVSHGAILQNSDEIRQGMAILVRIHISICTKCTLVRRFQAENTR